MKKTLLIGEPMGLFIAQQEGELESVTSWETSTSGAELNVAVGLKRLGEDVGYMTKLGRDPLGALLINRMHQDGIATEMISYSEDRTTGFQLKQKVTEGDPKVASFRKFSAASTLAYADFKDLDFSAYDWFHVTGILAGLSESTREATPHLSEIARQNGITFSYDPNLRPYLWKSPKEMADYMNMMAAVSDYYLPGVKENVACIGEADPEKAAGIYLESGCKCVVIKLGADGAYYATKNERGYVPGFHIDKIVDTVGAGDGFAAGFISGIKEGLSLPEAVRRANAIGAIQLTSKGDNEGLPTRPELEAFMAGEKNWRGAGK